MYKNRWDQRNFCTSANNTPVHKGTRHDEWTITESRDMHDIAHQKKIQRSARPCDNNVISLSISDKTIEIQFLDFLDF